MEALTSLGIAERIEPHLVPALDVRATLAYAESGNVDAAIVYATDAAVSLRIEVIYELPPSSHSPNTLSRGGPPSHSKRGARQTLPRLPPIRGGRADVR